MAGRIVYEDDRFILADFSDNFGVNYKLLLKREYRSVSIYSYTLDFEYVVHVEVTGRTPWQHIHVMTYMKPDYYKQFQNRLKKAVRSPKDFIQLALELISPEIASLCREVR